MGGQSTLLNYMLSLKNLVRVAVQDDLGHREWDFAPERGYQLPNCDSSCGQLISGEKGTYQYLVQKVLDELLVKGPRSQQTMQIGSEQFGHKVTMLHDIQAQQCKSQFEYTKLQPPPLAFAPQFFSNLHILQR
jgi:hypothetical protein